MHNKLITIAGVLTVAAAGAWAKLPPPSEEAQAKAAEAAAKSAHGGKVAAYKLCQTMDQVAAAYFADAKNTGKTVGAPVATPACVDPGPYVAAQPAK